MVYCRQRECVPCVDARDDGGDVVAYGGTKSGVVHDQRPGLDVEFAFPDERARGDDEAVLIDTGLHDGEPTGNGSTNIELVGFYGDEIDDFTLIKYRPDEQHIVDVRASPIWIVGNNDVPGPKFIWAILFNRVFYRLGHGAGKGGQSFTNDRSEEHTSELQSRGHIVCRL